MKVICSNPKCRRVHEDDNRPCPFCKSAPVYRSVVPDKYKIGDML
jgi:RNA polymerase subunit RPABC4/transcription elongation factor Spt4